MKSFQIPEFYKSPILSKVKEIRKENDPRKRDFSPSLLDFGPVRFYISRHFGFCYGVENAIEKAYQTIDENPDKRIFLLSQMIHNPGVNKDLLDRGVQFLMDTSGKQIIPFSKLTEDDIVIIPAFGTTIEIEKELSKMGLQVNRFNTTCPFVERVWKKAENLGEEKYTLIIHGQFAHEETRATFSRCEKFAPVIVVKDLYEAGILGAYILNTISHDDFEKVFRGKCSSHFNSALERKNDLLKIGVINQTTMLASETQEITDFLSNIMAQKYGAENLIKHFADTRDTLCYATNENQAATFGMLEKNADLAIVVGGYNSSNTSHIVELCEKKIITYFISSETEIVSGNNINHFNFSEKKRGATTDFLPDKTPVEILITSGASCPDSVVEAVIIKIVSFFDSARKVEDVMNEFEKSHCE